MVNLVDDEEKLSVNNRKKSYELLLDYENRIRKRLFMLDMGKIKEVC